MHIQPLRFVIELAGPNSQFEMFRFDPSTGTIHVMQTLDLASLLPLLARLESQTRSGRVVFGAEEEQYKVRQTNMQGARIQVKE